jgi:Flp pilus assembly protein TadD
MRIALLSLVFTAALAARQPDAGPSASYRQALDHYNRTEYPEAVAQLRAAPATAENLELLGRCLLMLAEHGKAVESLEKAAALNPAGSMTWTWLGRAYGRRAETAFPLAAVGWANKARQAFEKAVQLDGSNGEAVNDLFEFYLQAPPVVGGGQDKARALVPAIARIDPAEAAFAEAKLAEQHKSFTAAEGSLRRAIALAPTQVGRVLDLAKFLARQGRFDESDRTFDQAEQLDPKAPKVLYARAQTWIRAKRNVAAAKDLLARYLASPNRTPEDPSRADVQRLLRKAEGV